MENFFTNKKIWKMLIIAILVIMTMQIITPATVVFAVDEPEDAAQEGDNLLWAGILMRPILSLLVTVGDGVMNLLHSTIMVQDTSLITVEAGEWWEKAGAIILGALGAILIAAAILFIGFEIIIPAIAAFSEASGIALGALETGIGFASIIKAGQGAVIAGTIIAANFMPNTFKLPVYSYSPEEIFKNNILLFDVDFFNTMDDNDIMVNYSIYKDSTGSTDENGNSYGADNPDPNIGKSEEDKWETQSEDISKKEYDSRVKEGKEVYKVNYYYYLDNNGKKIKTSESYPARDLHNVIATWYVTIRNICIVMMLSILVYIGIRMMLTSVANDRAKYKEMIKDWAIGLCLLFIMHYIMSFSVVLVEKLTDVVKTNINENAIVVRLPDEYDGNLVDAMKKLGIDSSFYNEDEVFYPTNLMGKIRILLQLKDNAQTGTYIGYVICFIMLVTYTVVFTFTYLRRLLYMSFLTLMAPLVAMTYCIDKVNDGQAQGFNTWLKEYIFNLLIQPMHLLLYFILITSAFELASTNIVYSIIVLGFMIPAEKLLRGMFGFEKAKTPPSLLGAATGASLFMSAIRGLGNKGPRGDAQNKRIRTGNKELGENSNVDSSDDGMEAFLRTASISEDEQSASSDGEQSAEERKQILMDAYEQYRRCA